MCVLSNRIVKFISWIPIKFFTESSFIAVYKSINCTYGTLQKLTGIINWLLEDLIGLVVIRVPSNQAESMYC